MCVNIMHVAHGLCESGGADDAQQGLLIGRVEGDPGFKPSSKSGLLLGDGVLLRTKSYGRGERWEWRVRVQYSM